MIFETCKPTNTSAYINLYVLLILKLLTTLMGFPGGSGGKEFSCNAGDLGLVPGLGRSPGEGNGYPLQYSCLENSTDRGAWRASWWGHKQSDTTEQQTHSYCNIILHERNWKSNKRMKVKIKNWKQFIKKTERQAPKTDKTSCCRLKKGNSFRLSEAKSKLVLKFWYQLHHAVYTKFFNPHQMRIRRLSILIICFGMCFPNSIFLIKNNLLENIPSTFSICIVLLQIT